MATPGIVLGMQHLVDYIVYRIRTIDHVYEDLRCAHNNHEFQF
jgi:hypothetical protein